MLGSKKNQERPNSADDDQGKALLKSVLNGMGRKVELLLFADPAVNAAHASAARGLIRQLRELTAKVGFKEFSLNHELALKHRALHSPTLLLDPEGHDIRWLGAPAGEEASAFVQALLMLGHERTGLGGQALKVLGEIKEPRKVKVFVSPTCPYCPQQIVNAISAAVASPRLVAVEVVDVTALPELAERYGAFSTPTVYANERLIAQGAQPEELFMLSLKELSQQNVFIPDNDAPQIETDLVIVGGGPAGLTAGIYAARSGLKAVVVEKGALGGQVSTTPSVENYPGFTEVGGKALVDIMVSHALQYANIFPGEEVMDIAITPDRPMVIATNRRRFLARAVLLATGASHRRLGAPGEERLAGRGVSYCSTCDGPLFKGKRVLMVGGGDSAVTEALHLHQIGVEVVLAHRRGELRAQKRLLDTLLASGVAVLYNTEVKEIRGVNRVEEVELQNNLSGDIQIMQVEGVFVAIGYDPAVELARKLGLAMTEGGYIRKDSRHRTSVAGVYSAGDVEGGYKQIVVAAGQGAEAALTIFEDLMNPYWTGARAKGEREQS